MKFYIITFLLVLLSWAGYTQNLYPTMFKRLDNYKAGVQQMEYSSKSRYVVITTNDGLVELYDNQLNEYWSYQGNSKNGASKAVFSADEKYLIFTKYQSISDVAVLDIAKRKIIQQVYAHNDFITEITISPDGKYVVTGGADAKINICKWEANKLVTHQALDVNEESFQNTYVLEFSHDGKYLVTAGASYKIHIFSLQKDRFIESQQITQHNWVYSLTFHPKEEAFVIATTDAIISYMGNKGLFSEIKNVRALSPLAINFNNTGKYLVVGEGDGIIEIYAWDKGNVEFKNNLAMHTDKVCSIEFSKDNNYLTSSSLDKTAIAWVMPDADLPKTTETDPKNTSNIEESKGNVEQVNTKVDQINLTGEGKNYLFIVGINNYKYWKPLNNAIKDAKEIKQTLNERYNFDKENVVEIYDEEATKENIIKKLVEIRKKMSGNDNLLIYFSGHGYYNADIEEGYWVTTESQRGKEIDYLPNSTLLKYIKSIPAKHIFLVADACFSGALFADGSRGYIENVEQYKSRWGLTSGRLEYVSDGQEGKNSPFAKYFIKFLKENQKKKLPVSELVQYVKVAVSNNSDQTPIGNPLKSVGDEGGEFIFNLK